MNADTLAIIAAAVAAPCASWLTAKQANRSAEKVAARRAQTAAKAADGLAYERAQKINHEIVSDLEAQIARSDRRAEAAEQRAESAERRAESAERKAAECQFQFDGLRRTIQAMARQMQAQGMTPPPEALE